MNINIIEEQMNEIEIKESTRSNTPILDEEINIPSLTADGVPTIEEQLKLIAIEEAKVKKDEQKQKRRDLITKVKTICLSKMGKEPLLNTTYLTNIEKDTLIDFMNQYADKSEDMITTEFNAICTNKIFNNPKYDYTSYPIYNI